MDGLPFDPRLIGRLGYPPVVPADMSAVSELTAVEPFPGTVLPTVDPKNDLLKIRHQYPYLQILPFPRANPGCGIFLPTALTPGNINVPAEATIGLFRGSADFFVSKDGNALVPTAALADTGSIFRPDGYWFYLAGINQFSVVSASANCYVQLITLTADLSGIDVGRIFT